MKITYYGHACFAIETKGKTLLFDPFVTYNSLADIDVSTIKCDYILLSHAHQDHLADVEAVQAANPDAAVIGAFEVASHFGNKGMKMIPMNQGGKVELDFGTVKFVNAIHSSSFPDGSYGANPGGFVVWNEEGCFYYSGDTALTMDMQLIPMTCPPLTFGVFCIGDQVTMGAEDAAIAADFVRVDKVYGIHYDTFDFIKIDPAQAKEAFTAKGKELILLGIGESQTI